MTITEFTASSGDEDAAGLYWQAVGDGPPVLPIGGIGMDTGAWWRTVPVLARNFRVVTFDPRGLGRSAPCPLVSTTDDLAADCIALMDAAGAGAAHVYGFSLGGMVARTLALRHPDRVGRLVLGSIHAGGMLYQPWAGVISAIRHRRPLPSPLGHEHEVVDWPFNRREHNARGGPLRHL